MMKLPVRLLSNLSASNVGLRVVIVVFAVTFLQNLPLGQLPTPYDLYKALVLGAVAGLLLLERNPESNGGQSQGQSNSGDNQSLSQNSEEENPNFPLR
jgi:hypothetical protein